MTWILRFDGGSFARDGFEAGGVLKAEGTYWSNGLWEILAVEDARMRVRRP